VLSKPRQCRVKDKHVDLGIIDEYSVLRKSIEINKNLFVILKNPAGHAIPAGKPAQRNLPPSAGSGKKSVPMSSGSMRSMGNTMQGHGLRS
jgi:hypothetical protein